MRQSSSTLMNGSLENPPINETMCNNNPPLIQLLKEASHFQTEAKLWNALHFG